MIILVLGLALIVLILITILCALSNSDISELEINVVRPWKFSIKLKKKMTPKNLPRK